MNKRIAFLLTSCLLLCSCESDKQVSVPVSQPEPMGTTAATTVSETVSITSEESAETFDESLEIGFEKGSGYFIDYNAEKVYYKEAVKIEFCGNPISAEEAENLSTPFCFFDGWTYGFFSKGIYLNSVEDEFDPDEYRFVDEPADEDYPLKRITVGESFGTLKVSAASCTLVPTGDRYLPNGICLFESSLKLDGEITLTGYIGTLTEETGYSDKGDIFFLIDESQWNDIPVVAYPPYRAYLYYTDTFSQYSDTPVLTLGSVISDYSDLDISVIPKDGSLSHVRITVTDISMYANDSIRSAKGRIVCIEEI